MDKNKQQTKAKAAISPEQKRIINYVFSALLLSVVLGFVLWQTLVASVRQESFDRALTQLVQEHQQAIVDYLQSSQTALKRFTGDPLLRAALDNTNSNGVVEQTLENFLAQFAFAKTAKLYQVGAAQRQKDAGANISFVQLDMINRSETNADVYPEVAKTQDQQQWIIHWVAPVYGAQHADDSGESDIKAVLYVSSGIQGLTTALSQASLSQGQKQAKVSLIQNIDTQTPINFLSIGQGGGYGSKSADIPQSHWQVDISPSADFFSSAAPIPWWYILVMLLSLLVCCYLALALAQKKNKQIAATYKTLNSNPHFKSKKTVTQKAKTNLQHENNQPIFLSDAEITVNEEDEDLVAGVHQNKQNNSTAVTVDRAVSSADASHSNKNPQSPAAARPDPALALQVPDTIFRAYDIRGIVDQELTPAIAEAIGRAVASEALEQGETSILVGHDARTHSPLFYEYIQKGVLSTGCDVIAIGLAPTPLLNFATVFSEATSSGIIVTASHNPKHYNGFKVVINEHTLLEADIQRLKQRINSGQVKRSNALGRVIEENFEEDYRDTIMADIAVNTDLKVVIDAANGAAGNLAPQVFNDLGCEVTPLFCDVNGEFPNHDPDPSVIDNLQPLIAQVKAAQADMGIALDGDGDRIVVISSSGQVIWPDQLLMIFAREVVSRNPGCDIIFDVKSTRRLNQIISSYGGRPVMWKTGHSHIKAKMRETNALLAGEFSGHIFFKERWFGFDDGVYAAARLLEIMSLRDQSLDDMLDSLPKMVSTPEIKIPATEDNKFTIINTLIESGDFASGEKTTLDGLRVDFAKGWGLVRASNTSPALTLRFEADNASGVEQIKALFKRELAKIDKTLAVNF